MTTTTATKIDPNGFTVSDIEKGSNISRRAADGIIAFFREKNWVEETGQVRKVPGAKGKGATLYRVKAGNVPGWVHESLFNTDEL